MEDNKRIRRTIIFGKEAAEFLKNENVSADNVETLLASSGIDYDIQTYDFTIDQWEAYVMALDDMSGWCDYKIY